MSDGFTVRPDTLRQLADNLNNVSNTLNGLGDQRSANEDAIRCDDTGQEPNDYHGSFGRDAFESAGQELNNFVGDWSNAIAKIVADTKTVARALNDAAGAYNTTDQNLATPLQEAGH